MSKTSSRCRTILGCDPGSVNFGVSVVNWYSNKKFPEILFSGQLRQLVKSISEKDDYNLQFKNFLTEYKQLLLNFEPDSIIVERLMVRGFLLALVELTNIQNGLIISLAQRKKIKFSFVTAASWKNKFKRETGYDLKQFYTDAKHFCSPHQLDSFLQTNYYASKSINKDFTWLASNKNRKWLLQQLKKASIVPF